MDGVSLRRSRPFRRYWSAQTVSQLGDRVSELALPLIAVSMLHANAAEIGLLSAAIWLPYLGSLFVGSWVDRQQHPRRVLVCADLARVLLLGAVPALYAVGALRLWQLFVIAIMLGIGAVFFNTALPNVFVTLVRPDEYVAAGSAVSASRAGSYIAGPALGGWLVQVFGGPFALLADAVSFAGSAALLGRLPLRERRSRTESVPRRTRDGLHFVLHHRYLRAMLGSSTTINFFSFIGTALFVLYARRTLGLSAGVIGVAFGVGASGSLFGAVIAPSLGRRWGIGRVAVLGAIVFPLSMAIPILAGGPTFARAAVLTAAEIASGVGIMLYDVSLNAIKTAVTPDAMRSRVTGAYSTINYGCRPLGAVIGGLLGSTIGIRPTLLLAAIGGTLSIRWLIGSPISRVRAIADLDSTAPTTAEQRTKRGTVMTPDDWRTDLDALAQGLTDRHRDPFQHVSQTQFATAVNDVHSRIPELPDSSILVGFDAIAAMMGDGHTFVESDDRYRQFPLTLFWYGDELRVTDALTDDPRVLGARVIAINGIDIAEIDRRVQRLIPQGENTFYVRARSAERITRADVLAALDCLPDNSAGSFTFVADGAQFDVRIAARPVGRKPRFSPRAGIRYERPEESLAYAELPDAGYVNFRSYHGLEDNAAQLITRVRDTGVPRLLIDLRDNGGGDYTLARQHLIYPIWRLPDINRHGGLFVLIGRQTFSAAMVTATDFRRETEAVLVGEPTGANPVGCQELGTLVLPRSGIAAHYATRRYRFSDARSPAVFPDQHVAPDWNAEHAGRDPAVEWCLAQSTAGSAYS